MEQLIFGSDPEFFSATPDGNGGVKVVPPAKYRLDFGHPVTILDNDPQGKHPVFAEVPGLNGVVRVIEDGAAFELTVPPSHTIEGLFHDIQVGYEVGSQIMAQYGNFIEVTPAIHFDTNEFRNRKKEFLMSLIFGCDEDRDVYELMGLIQSLPKEEDALEHPWRYGGGHWHVSGIKNFQEKPLPSVRMFGMFIGNLVTFRSPQKELDHVRTYRYGRPGRFRIQEYGKLFEDIPWTDIGIEYRTPSNAWTTDISLARLMAETMQMVAEQVLPNDSLMEVLIEDLEARTVEAVMTGNEKMAEENYHAAMSMIR